MIELVFQFNRLFQLQVNHNFYEDGKWNECVLVPGLETSRLLKKLNMLYREESAGFTILHDASKKESLISQLKADDYELNFYLFPKNPYYLNFTELPVEAVDRVAYFSTESVKNSPDTKVKLHESETVGEKDFYKALQQDFAFSPEDGKECELLNAKNEVVAKKEIDQTGVTYIDSSKLIPGKYFVNLDKKLSKTLVLLNEPLRGNPISLVNISLSGGLKKSILDTLEKGEDLPPYSYEINFSSRSTYWKYFVVPKYSKELDKSVIKDLGKKLDFSTPKPCDLQNGMKAYCFVSDQPIQLNELPKVKFQLKKANGKETGGKSLIDLLPVPSVDRVVPIREGKDLKIYSEVIIYL